MLTIVPASRSATTQVFDANGNLKLSTTGSAVTTNIWSPDNRLLSQISPTVNEQYQYSQDGMRQQKINGTGTTQFTLDGPNVLLETTGAGALQARNTQNPSGYGGLVSQNRISTSNYYGFDTQQSTRILVSAGGMITDSLSFKAFGEELQTGSGTVNPFWFGGQVGYFRDQPGIMNVGNRRLNAANGVWVNRDLIGFAGGDVNLMRYVENNPITGIDPAGLTSISIHINAFIHKIEDKLPFVQSCGKQYNGPWAIAGWNPWGLLYYEGDHRSFFESGTSRVHSTVTFDTCLLGKLKRGDISYNLTADRSRSIFAFSTGGEGGGYCEYELSGRSNPPGDIAINGQNYPCTSEAWSAINISWKGCNPTLPPLITPCIQFDAALIVAANGVGNVTAVLNGNHTEYPWFEAYATVGAGPQTQMYTYSATPGNVFWGLISTTQFSSKQVVLHAQTPPCSCPCS